MFQREMRPISVECDSKQQWILRLNKLFVHPTVEVEELLQYALNLHLTIQYLSLFSQNLYRGMVTVIFNTT